MAGQSPVNYTYHNSSDPNNVPSLELICAHLCNDVYNKPDSREGFFGYERVVNLRDILPPHYHRTWSYPRYTKTEMTHLQNLSIGSTDDSQSGYKVQIYAKTPKNFKIYNNVYYPYFIVAFAGTEPVSISEIPKWQDYPKLRKILSQSPYLITAAQILTIEGWLFANRDHLANFSAGLGVAETQYKNASLLGESLKELVSDEKQSKGGGTHWLPNNITYTGHSLGGGLAACASLVDKERKAIVFNSSGVPYELKPWFGSFQNYDINRYHNKYDILSNILNISATFNE